MQAAQSAHAAGQPPAAATTISPPSHDITISLQDPPHRMSATDVCNLTLPAFAALWTVSGRTCANKTDVATTLHCSAPISSALRHGIPSAWIPGSAPCFAFSFKPWDCTSPCTTLAVA